MCCQQRLQLPLQHPPGFKYHELFEEPHHRRAADDSLTAKAASVTVFMTSTQKSDFNTHRVLTSLASHTRVHLTNPKLVNPKLEPSDTRVHLTNSKHVNPKLEPSDKFGP